MGDFIGAGNFGQVFRAMEVESGRIIAIKNIPFTHRVSTENINTLEVTFSNSTYLKAIFHFSFRTSWVFCKN